MLPNYLSPQLFEQVDWVQGDLFDVVGLEEALQGVDAVIHAAAIVSFQKRERNRMYKTNVEGTANVINAAIDAGIKRFVHISSVAAIGRSLNEEAVDESKPWTDSKAHTHYAISKYHGEMEAWRGMGEGLDLVIANPSTIIGYGNWNSSSSALFKNVFDEFPWYSTGVNGFVDVEDCARAVVQLMESKHQGERYIISGDNWSFQQLFKSMATHLGKRPPYRKATPLLGEIAWRWEKLKSLFTGRKPLLSRENARVAHSKTRFSNQKILTALPQFEFTPLEESIAKACKHYLRQEPLT